MLQAQAVKELTAGRRKTASAAHSTGAGHGRNPSLEAVRPPSTCPVCEMRVTEMRDASPDRWGR